MPSDGPLYQMLRIRMVEERIADLYPSDVIQSPIHLSIGQEAVAVGVCAHLKPTDLLFATCRGHAWYLAKGGDLRQMMAELYGKATGCAHGKGGSMHLCAPEVGFMGTSAIVASTIPHAVGAALAAKRRGSNDLVVAVFGDGAADAGVLHESLNFAALHSLPVIFVCEDNGLAVHSPKSARQAFSLDQLPKAYGLGVHRVWHGSDGWDVARNMGYAVNQVRQAPQFVLVPTYRYREHVGPGQDHDAGYRAPAELDYWQAHDPLLRLPPSTLADFRVEIKAEIDDAVRYAEESPWPKYYEILENVT